MCLDVVKKKFEQNDKMVMAYKVYRKCPKTYAEIHRGGYRKEGKYYRAEGGICYQGYELGFHAYTNFKHAKRIANYAGGCVCKVLLWDVIAKGKEGNPRKNVIVGRNMRIMEEICSVE